MESPAFSRRLAAELIGTAFLVAAVVGSGIMAERLAGGNVALALLANTIATGAALVFLILMLGPISGSHLNPAVTLAATLLGDLPKRDGVLYSLVQLAGAVTGVIIANLMFDMPAVAASTKVRTGIGVWLGEIVATFGLIGVVITVGRRGNVAQTAAAVSTFITAGYWFTSSTSFANPVVTIGRTMTDTFTGIRPADAPAFLVAQVAAAIAATKVFEWLNRKNEWKKESGY